MRNLTLTAQSQALQWALERENPVLPKSENDKPVQFWQFKKNGSKVVVSFSYYLHPFEHPVGILFQPRNQNSSRNAAGLGQRRIVCRLDGISFSQFLTIFGGPLMLVQGLVCSLTIVHSTI
jgi:hypothetical protein